MVAGELHMNRTYAQNLHSNQFMEKDNQDKYWGFKVNLYDS